VNDVIAFQAAWRHLVTIADECWTATYRAAYSTIIGEALDVGCELLDAHGNSLAHAVRSIPVFNMIMPNTVRAVLARYADRIEDGDVFVTNDPWLCAGHLPDVAVVTPIFLDGSLVAFAANVANLSDIGGNLNRPANRELFDEGLQIPVVKVRSRGERLPEVWDLILANVRTPEEVEGDLEAMTAANRLAATRVLEFMRARGMLSLEELSTAICDQSERAMRKVIATLPDGVYDSEWTADGLRAPVRLKIRLEIRGSEIEVKFPDAPPQVEEGAFNCTLTYTTGHVNYALKCLIGPDIPTNEGCFKPINVSAPEGSVLNCRRPAAVDMRTRIGWQVHPLIFGAMSKVVGLQTPAGCGQPSLMSLDGAWLDGRRFQEHLILGAGMGAWSGGDGESNSTFPSSAASTSVEVIEQRSPVWVAARRLSRGSGGTGLHTGGEGEQARIGLRPGQGEWLRIVTALERMTVPPYGLEGAEPGARSTLVVETGGSSQPTAERVVELRDGDWLTMTTAGGGGFGSPAGSACAGPEEA
jgi:N-methylhydantoinase B/oxoprolinase/acetone carboxylase alpha subunit